MDSSMTNEKLLERVGFMHPNVTDDTSFTSTVKVEYPLGKEGRYSDPYLAGQTIKLATNNKSNELTNFRDSYLVYEDSITYDVTVNYLAAFDTDPYSFPTIMSGIPFSDVVEMVNGNTEIHTCLGNYNRHATLNMLCSGNGNDCGMVTGVNLAGTAWATGPPTINGFKPTGWVAPTITGLVSRTYRDHINTAYERVNCNVVKLPDGSPGVQHRRLQILPLEVVSKLATTAHLVPTGLLSQTSMSGWSLNLTLAANEDQYCIPSTPPSTQFLGNARYELYNPKLVTRIVSIVDMNIMTSLINDFNLKPRFIPLGNGETVAIEKQILLPFNNATYFNDFMPAGFTNHTVQFNVPQKSLKGMALRFRDPTVWSTSVGRVERNMIDTFVDLKSIQVKIGDLRWPRDLISIENSNVNSNRIYRLYNASGEHLLDPRNICNNGESNTAILLNNVFNNTFDFASIIISFEGLQQMQSESTQGDYSYGVNTFLNGNVVEINLEFNSGLIYNTTMEVQFIYQDLLMIANGCVERVFNKQIINTPVIA